MKDTDLSEITTSNNKKQRTKKKPNKQDSEKVDVSSHGSLLYFKVLNDLEKSECKWQDLP